MKWNKLAAIFLMAAVSAAAAADQESSPPDRLLLLAVDAVPFSVAEELTQGAARRGEPTIFKEFKGPARLISTFPSFTTIAFSGILQPLGIGSAPGYEARFFDVAMNRKRGAGARSYYEIPFPWRDFFDWKIKSFLFKGLGYLSPDRVTRHELRESFAAFAASNSTRFSIYIGNSDTVAHMSGRPGIRNVFVQLDETLTRFKAEHPGLKFTTVMFSDHGMSDEGHLINVRTDVRRALRQAGFRVGRSLNKEKSAVTVPFGLISNGAVFTSAGHEAEAAAALCRVPAVDLCVWRAGSGWRVRNAEGAASIVRERRNGVDWWSYVPEDADPLGYEPVIAELQRRAGAAADGYFPDDWWFEATAAHRYPDGLYRLAQSFTLVRNPASVEFSLKAGHMHGALKTKMGAAVSVGRLGGTHGALLAEPSLGFMMSDAAEWQPPFAVRYDKALLPFTRAWAERGGQAPVR